MNKPVKIFHVLVLVLLACDEAPVTAPTEETPGTLMRGLAEAVNNGDALAYSEFLADEYTFRSYVDGAAVEYDRTADYEAVNAMINSATSYGLEVEWQTIPTPPDDYTEFTYRVAYQWFAKKANLSYCAEGSGEITFRKPEISEMDDPPWLITTWDDDETGETTSLPDFSPITLGELKALFQ